MKTAEESRLPYALVVASLILLLAVPAVLERGARLVEQQISERAMAVSEVVGMVAVTLSRPSGSEIKPGSTVEATARVRQRYREVTRAVRRLDLLERQVPEVAAAHVSELKDELADWATLLSAAEREGAEHPGSTAIREQRDRVATRLTELHAAVTSIQAEELQDVEALRRARNTTMILLAFAAFASVLLMGRIVERLRRSRYESERERREKAALLESTADGVLGIDLNGRCKFINPMAAALLGTTPARAVDQDAAELFRITQWSALSGPTTVSAPFRPDSVGRFEVEVLREDGTTFTAECSRSPIMGDGEIRGAVIIFRDITARKQEDGERGEFLKREQEARARAEAAQRRAGSLAEASEVFAGSLDHDTTLRTLSALVVPRIADSCIIYLLDENGEIRRLEPTHVHPEKEALLRQQLDRHPPRLESLIPPVASALRTGKSTLVSNITPETLKRNPGDSSHASVVEELELDSLIVTPLRARDRIIGAISYGVSSARRYGPEDLVFAEDLASRAALAIDNARLHGEAQHAIQIRDDVLKIASHDLRSPLSVIRLGSQALLRGIPDSEADKPEVRQLQVIRRSAEHMHRLIEDLLAVSQIEADLLAIRPERVNLTELMGEICELLEPVAKERGISLCQAVDADLPDVWVDEERLVQVFTNLVHNAIKFTPAEGTITLSTIVDGDEICISVADTGPGIAADEMPHLFDRHWQTQRKRTTGAGLGLAICKGIVTRHGGRIWAESREAEGGTVFRFTMPMFDHQRHLRTRTSNRRLQSGTRPAQRRGRSVQLSA